METEMINEFEGFTGDLLADAYEEAFPNDWFNEATLWKQADDGWKFTGISAKDPYELIDVVAAFGQFGEAAIVMHGWAAPITEIDEYVAPSQSPNRSRLRLFVMIYGNKFAHGIVFQDTKEYEEMDEQGSGPLADAINQALARI